MYVISSKSGKKYDCVKYEAMDPKVYNETFEKNVPEKPFGDPITDPLACFLFQNPPILQKLIFHLSTYDCFDPVYVDGKVMHPTQFLYENVFGRFANMILDPKYKKNFMDNWRKYVMLAIAKLTGKIYNSAGKD